MSIHILHKRPQLQHAFRYQRQVRREELGYLSLAAALAVEVGIGYGDRLAVRGRKTIPWGEQHKRLLHVVLLLQRTKY